MTSISSATAKGSTLIWVAQVFSLVSAASFAFGAITYQIAFSVWDINFLQIATPADVLMSGMDYLFRSVFSVGAVMLGARLASAGADIMVPKPKIYPFFYIAFTIIALNVVPILTWRLEELVPMAVVGIPASVMMFVVMTTCMLLFGMILAVSVRRFTGAAREWVSGIVLVGIVLGTIVPHSVAAAAVGFSNPPLLLKASGCNGQVIWIGSRSVLLRCGTGEVQVLHNAENLVLSVSRQAPDGARLEASKIAGG